MTRGEAQHSMEKSNSVIHIVPVLLYTYSSTLGREMRGVKEESMSLVDPWWTVGNS